MGRISLRRKLAFATWGTPREGNIYGKLTVDATRALEHLERLRRDTGEKVTISHLVVRAMGRALREVPGLNGQVWLGRFRPHRTADVSVLVALDGGADLAQAKIEHVDRKSIPEIARELRERTEQIRAHRDREFEQGLVMIRWLPGFLLAPLLRFTGFLTGVLGVNLRSLGLEPFPFGACVITNVGMFGLDEGYAPPLPFAHVPLTILIGAIHQRREVTENGQVISRSEVTLCATIDHRFIDGAQVGRLAKIVREAFEDPARVDERGNESAPADCRS